MARIERRVIERRQPVGGRERVHGEQAFRRAVKAGRMIGVGAAGEVRRHRPRGRRRRAECAEAVEHAARRQRLRARPSAPTRSAFAGRVPASADDALEHVDEGAGERQVRPARVGGDVKQHDHALAAARGGDQRRAVGERRPGAVGQAGVRLGQHLPRHRHVVRHRHAVERAFARERGELLRLIPAQACRRACGRRGAASPARDRRRRPQAAGRRSAPARRRPRPICASRSRARRRRCRRRRGSASAGSGR